MRASEEQPRPDFLETNALDGAARQKRGEKKGNSKEQIFRSDETGLVGVIEEDAEQCEGEAGDSVW